MEREVGRRHAPGDFFGMQVSACIAASAAKKVAGLSRWSTRCPVRSGHVHLDTLLHHGVGVLRRVFAAQDLTGGLIVELPER